MPRTKLDQRARLSPAEARSRIIRAAGARIGLHRDKDLADALGVSPSCIHAKLTGTRPWGVDNLSDLSRILRLTDEEIALFVRGRCG